MFFNRSNRLIILMAIMTIFVSCCMAESKSDSVAPDTIGTLVTTEWLSKHLNDSDLVVLDCTVYMVPDSGGGMQAMSGYAKYKDGHIPSAGFADLLGDLCNINSPLKFALPTPEQFCIAMGKLGVGNESRVVLYDAFNSVWAARIWWMLRWVGFDRAALLDGGFKAWTAEGRELSTEPSGNHVGQLTPALRPELIADRDEVFAALGNDKICLIDAMPPPHFRGEMAMYGRPGHIPGAKNIPAMGLLNESGRYRPKNELSVMFTGDRDARSITYCGGGIAASSNAFIMTRLGFSDVAVYMGSLEEWAADPANPLEAGEH